MKKKCLVKVLMMASFVAVLGGFSSCQDYSEERYSSVLSKLDDQNTTLSDALAAQKEDLTIMIAELEAALQEAQKENADQDLDIANLQSQIDALKALIGNDNSGKTIVEQIAEINLAIANVAGRVEELEKWKESIVGWGDRLTQVELDAAAALAAAQTANDSIKIVADSVYQAAVDYVDAQITLLGDSMIETIGELAKEMATADSILADSLDAVAAKVSVLENQIAAIKGDLNKMITSLIIQGTQNPVMGSIATPFNTRSNILAAYYGSVGSQGLEFPTDKGRFYVDNANVLMTDKDLQMLNVAPVAKSEGVVLLGDEGNAGTLYITVNPNTVDYTGAKFALVNSLDVNSGVELGTLEPSDATLKFGYTRAAKNGFYEASATIAEENLEDCKLKLNLGEIKEVAQDIANGNKVSVSQLASVVSNTMEAFSMDANGLKASWYDSDSIEHSVYSQYGVAVTAIKPLSYSFAKDLNVSNVPGLDRIESLIGKLTEKSKEAIRKLDKLTNLELVEIKYVEIPKTPQVDSIEVVVNIPSQEIKDENGNVIGTSPVYTDTIRVSIQDVIDELYGDMVGSFDDVNTMLKEIQQMEDQINSILNDAKNLQSSAINAADKVQEKLTSFLNKFNDLFCKAINSTNKVLRPVMFVSTTNGFHKLSQAQNNPTVITGTELSLLPTSYTLEYLAPAYKKLVGVTNVFKGSANAQAGDADCLAALNNVNAQAGVAEILDGETFVIDATFEPGYVYEVVYTAVDFFGMVDTKKFYVAVK